MKICIYGAGAIGGYLGVKLAQAGADISLVARGAHLAAMQANGLKLLVGDENASGAAALHRQSRRTRASQDVVIICLKAHSITGVIAQMQPLLGPHTRIVTAVNGIPYWYFYKHGNAIRRLDCWRASTPADGNGASSAPSARSAASSIPRPRSKRPA